jgi:hypothetical protein
MAPSVQFAESTTQFGGQSDSSSTTSSSDNDTTGQTPVSIESFDNVEFPKYEGPHYEDPFEAISQGHEAKHAWGIPTDDVSFGTMAPSTDDSLSAHTANHVSLPYFQHSKTNSNGHRVLRSATVGYVAPAFEGKTRQMLQGWSIFNEQCHSQLTLL